ncbi:MAG: aldo/keto reductase [Chloroflexi bacterium]|nr:aldo/keto reductase [Chloroflexota bacterium]
MSKTGAHGYEEVKKKIKLSLDHLKTDYIDIYEFHNLADKHKLEIALSKEGSIKALLEAKNAGLIKHIAVTSHNPDTCIAAIKSGYFEAAVFPFNFVAHDTAKRVLVACREQYKKYNQVY